jgi:hypothetical protein
MLFYAGADFHATDAAGRTPFAVATAEARAALALLGVRR